MAKRFGGKYSPEDGPRDTQVPRERVEVDPVGGRANLLFVPPVVLLLTSLTGGALTLASGLIGAGTLGLAAWLLREGLQAEAEYRARKVARRPAIPRKIFASVATGVGTAFAVAAHLNSWGDLLAPVIFGLCTAGLHLAAFGIDPLRNKGMENIDTFQQDRVARVVGEAERLLVSMREAIQRAGDRRAEARLAQFQTTAREMIRTVEEDPRDLTAARKYLVVYLQGAHDATVKFADLYARSGDAEARADYFTLLDDLDQNFAARTRKLMIEDRGDLTVEIDVLRERLSREGVRLD